MNIIGVNGYKRSGKGETSRAIDLLCEGVHMLGFADKLKILAARTLGYLPAFYTDQDCIDLMDQAKEKWYLDVRRLGNNTRVTHKHGLGGPKVTMRAYLQNLGNEARGIFGEDFWVDQVLPVADVTDYEQMQHELHAMHPFASTLVFTDLRYENEAQRIKDLGGFNIEVVRPGNTSDGHASEKRLPRHLIDHVVVNDKGLKDLQWEVNKVLELEDLC